MTPNQPVADSLNFQSDQTRGPDPLSLNLSLRNPSAVCPPVSPSSTLGLHRCNSLIAVLRWCNSFFGVHPSSMLLPLQPYSLSSEALSPLWCPYTLLCRSFDCMIFLILLEVWHLFQSMFFELLFSPHNPHIWRIIRVCTLRPRIACVMKPHFCSLIDILWYH